MATTTATTTTTSTRRPLLLPFLPVLLLSFFLLATTSRGAEAIADQCTSMSAAYNSKHFLTLFFQNSVTVFKNQQYRFRKPKSVRRFMFHLPNIAVDAAYRSVRHPANVFLTSGDHYFRTQFHQNIQGPIPMRRKFPLSKVFVKGIDAAAVQGGLVFYFKACRVIRRHPNGLRHVSNIRTMGIPCNIDAAWSSNGRIIVVKGPFAWEMDAIARKAELTCFYCRPEAKATGPKVSKI